MSVVTTPAPPKVILPPKIVNMPWPALHRLMVDQSTGIIVQGGDNLGGYLDMKVLDIKPVALRMWKNAIWVFTPGEREGVFPYLVKSYDDKTAINATWGIMYRLFSRRTGLATLFISPYVMWKCGAFQKDSVIALSVRWEFPKDRPAWKRFHIEIVK